MLTHTPTLHWYVGSLASRRAGCSAHGRRRTRTQAVRIRACEWRAYTSTAVRSVRGMRMQARPVPIRACVVGCACTARPWQQHPTLSVLLQQQPCALCVCGQVHRHWGSAKEVRVAAAAHTCRAAVCAVRGCCATPRPPGGRPKRKLPGPASAISPCTYLEPQRRALFEHARLAKHPRSHTPDLGVPSGIACHRPPYPR